MSRGVAGFAISGANVESAPLSLATSHFLSESPESSRGEVISEWLPFALLLFSRYVMSNSCDPMDYTVHGFSKPESLLQGIFPTQGLNLGLLHCRQIPYHLRHSLLLAKGQQ